MNQFCRIAKTSICVLPDGRCQLPAASWKMEIAARFHISTIRNWQLTELGLQVSSKSFIFFTNIICWSLDSNQDVNLSYYSPKHKIHSQITDGIGNSATVSFEMATQYISLQVPTSKLRKQCSLQIFTEIPWQSKKKISQFCGWIWKEQSSLRLEMSAKILLPTSGSSQTRQKRWPAHGGVVIV